MTAWKKTAKKFKDEYRQVTRDQMKQLKT